MPPARLIPAARPIESSVSVIIPTLNEEQRLPILLEMLALEAPRPEVIVVDGGSLDHTVDKATIWANQVLTAAPGRGFQLNQGAKVASGDVLWFLHADSEPPKRAIAQILEVLHNRPELLGGAFRLKFDRSSLGMRAISFGANVRSRLFSMPWGDQGLFVRKSVFQELGGFPDWPVMEDFAFQKLLAQKGKTVLLKDALTTSARRYEKFGKMKAMAMNFNTLWWHYRGKSAEEIQKKFRRLDEQGGNVDA
ncbi:MAG: TIGR04283 family arsenosugar biosynthesis glycosyltransferase [Calditrichaeota bacterium]|nr:TIGR04283 family arsenosugar biosynthesis glycosyltransferase [Calditrichota bacterium]MCB9369764.1 TIGR04283 family arsenosugar biosynthesis glycosyltransferase [Calditrichota bacterium]